MPPRRRSLLVAAQLVGAALLIYYIGRSLATQWTEFRAQPLETDVGVGALLASAALVLGTYALLIQVWRLLLASSGASLRFWPAARIWSISNLWRYVPGKVWQIGVMSAMAARERVRPEAAAGAAILSTVLNIATGLGLVLLLTGSVMEQWSGRARGAVMLLLGLAALGLVALPWILPRLSALAARLAGREVQLTAPAPGAIALATVGNLLSWALYGVAFLWLARGILGDVGGATWQYIAIFTASYVVGYLFLILPGGIGPREAVMLWLLTALGLATEKQALLLTVTSRLWLTLLELAPGLLFLAFDRMRSTPSPPDPRPDVTPSTQ